MKKYYYSKDKKEWSKGLYLPMLIKEVVSKKLSGETFIWYSNLCPNRTKLPKNCGHLYKSSRIKYLMGIPKILYQKKNASKTSILQDNIKITEYMKLEKLKKNELVEYCNSIGIGTKKKTKSDLLEEVYAYRKQLITDSINDSRSLEYLTDLIENLAEEYATQLDGKIASRKEEMKSDDTSHYLIYRVLGISPEDGQLIDEYQNTGRFLYKYAGSFLEEAASLCLQFNNLQGSKTLVDNTEGKKPKTFEIDFLDGNDAIEVKWRDATTDGDHITKEHTRVKVIKGHGYKPIRVMFYYPQREQAIKIQDTLKTIYTGVQGEYYAGDEAWEFIRNRTNFDLKEILTQIADKRTPIK